MRRSKLINSHFHAKRQKGMTLIELLLVIGIGALFIAGSFMLFGNASDKDKARTMIQQYGSLQAAVHGIYSGAPNYSGLTSLGVAQSKALPPSMVSNGTDITYPWGIITLAPVFSNTQWSATYPANTIPTAVCVQFASSILRSVRSVTIGGSSVTDANGIITACNANGGETAGAIVVTSN